MSRDLFAIKQILRKLDEIKSLYQAKISRIDDRYKISESKERLASYEKELYTGIDQIIEIEGFLKQNKDRLASEIERYRLLKILRRFNPENIDFKENELETKQDLKLMLSKDKDLKTKLRDLQMELGILEESIRFEQEGLDKKEDEIEEIETYLKIIEKIDTKMDRFRCSNTQVQFEIFKDICKNFLTEEQNRQLNTESAIHLLASLAWPERAEEGGAAMSGEEVIPIVNIIPIIPLMELPSPLSSYPEVFGLAFIPDLNLMPPARLVVPDSEAISKRKAMSRGSSTDISGKFTPIARDSGPERS